MSAGCVRCDVMHARNAMAVGPLRRTCEIHARPLPTTRSTTSDTVVRSAFDLRMREAQDRERGVM